MNLRKTTLTALLSLVLAAPIVAQDAGAPDSIKLAFVTPPVVGSNVPVVVECSVKVDANLLGSITMAWKWDNSALVMDSAKAQGDFLVMDIRSFYLNDVLALTNDSQVALCSGVDFGSGFPTAPGWRRVATYYMHATNWTSSSFLHIDTIQILPDYAATEYLFVGTLGEVIYPGWGGPITAGSEPQNLVVSPTLFNKSANEGGASPATDSVNVTVDAGGSIAYTLTENISWLSLNKAGGNTPDKFAIIYNTAALAAGSYVDSIQVASAAAANSPRYVKINLNINAVPKFLDVSPDTLYFTAVENSANPALKKFAVTETGGFAIVYTVSENSARISLNKAGGTTPDSVGVNVNIAGLTPGVYVDSVIVASAAASNSPIKEYIRTEITAAPKFLDVIPDTTSFTAQEGGSNPADQKFVVRETGNYNIAFTLAENTSWFSLNKASGTTPDTVTVSVDITGLVPDTYYGNIAVASGLANNSPISETIKLVITAKPRILQASPNIFNFNIVDGADPFSPVTVQVSDSFDVGLAYIVGDGVSWANVLPAAGTTPDSFQIIADTAAVAALGPGLYLDTVLISSATASNSPVPVYVNLEIVTTPNNPPVIAPIDNYFIFEGDFLVVPVVATDADDDPIYLSHGILPANANFFDSGNGNGYFTFAPNFSQAGDYLFTAYASDLDDTTSEDFNVHVTDNEPGTEGDTLHIGTVPAVPGQQVVVPVEIANSCDLYAVDIPFTWKSDNVIYLDSIKFNDALLGGISNKFVSIDNDGWLGEFGFTVDISELPIPPGHHALADMFFSVSPVTPQGVYGINPGLLSTSFTRNCSDFGEVIIPVIPGGGGNIIVDTTNVYVCGYVVDDDGVGIWGAQVELWPDFPCDGPIQTTLTNGDGAYAFTNFSLGSFDLYAWKRGLDSTTWNDAYYPNSVHVNFGENGIMILLHGLEVLVPSDQWVDYFCNENTFFNCPLPIGSIVEVWDEDDVLCGRQFVREPGNYRFMPVYRDSSGSVEDEGAVTGDNLRFFIDGIQALTTGNTIYPAAYTQVEVCLSGGARLTQECILNTGWNLVSWNLDTDTDDIGEVLSSLNGCIEVVLGFEQGGLTYVPGMDLFNTLTAVDHLSGYWIKLGDNCNHTLEVSGVPVEQDTPIPVNSRWNLVSYLPNDVHAIQDALYSLAGNLQITYTYDVTPLVFVPGQDPFNTLTLMEPCFGYWLKLDHAGLLTYPSAVGAAPKIEPTVPVASLSDKTGPVEPTRLWVNLYSHHLTIDENVVSSGDIVTAHASNGHVIGYYEMKSSGTFGFMPVYADAADETVAGIKKGETFYLQVNGIKTNEEFTWTEQGALIEVAALTTGGNNTLPESYELEQNYPNPFNPSTTISFSLPTASEATLEIYNLLGQKVATLYDGFAEAGEHKVVWDGRTLNGETASSGIYLYRLTAGQFVKTLKMTLVK